MKLLRGMQSPIELARGSVVTIGNFDGVHLGHQDLIQRLKEKARALSLPLVVVLFEPQPREFFHGKEAPVRLSSLREKIEILQSSHVDYVYCIKFDSVFAKTQAEDFARGCLFEVLKAKYLLLGEDFRFGNNRSGTFDLLKAIGLEYSCQVETSPDFLIENYKVSSTKIRDALKDSDFNRASLYLGRKYHICSRVIKGDGRGGQWGIPTANLCVKWRSLPLSGVFVVQAKIRGKMVQGVANIGNRPTVNGTKTVLEVHLFQFNEVIYGEFIQVFFLHKLRDEVKFTSVEALIEQIHEDIKAAKITFYQSD